MKKYDALTITLISIILFTVFFVAMLILFGDIVILNSSLNSFTREYFDWYLDSYWPSLNHMSQMIEAVTSIVRMVFTLIFTLEFIYIVSDEKYQKRVDEKNLVISIILGLIINYLISTFIKYNVEHYRLFMTIISTEIYSLVLLNMVLKLKVSHKMEQHRAAKM